MKKQTIYILFASGILMLGACTTPPAQEEEAGHHEEEQHEENAVSLTGDQMAAIGIKTGPLSRRYLGASIKANGRLEVPPQNEAKVSAYQGGNVQRINVIEGDKVQKGQTLAILEHPDLITIQQDYQEALNRLAFLEMEYARKKKLFEEEIGSGKDFQQVESEYKTMQSRAAALKAKLHMLDIDPAAVAEGRIYPAIPVKTPISGYIRAVDVVTGQYVQPQQELFEVVDNSHIHADLMVYERDIPRLREGQKVIFTAAGMPERELSASIYSVGKAFEEDPKAVHVHAEIENGKGDLIPGMYVQGRIITDETQVLALPEEGVVIEGDRSYLFLLTDEPAHAGEHSDEAPAGEHSDEGPSGGAHDDHAKSQAFRMVEVGTGVKEAGFVEIKPVTKLPDSARVVTEGAYYLLAEMKKGEAGHSH